MPPASRSSAGGSPRNGSRKIAASNARAHEVAPESPRRGPAVSFFPNALEQSPPSPRRSRSGKNKELPPLFWYMEAGDWQKAEERIQRHPREAKTWATIKTRSESGDGSKKGGNKRLALHHACFKLRSVGSSPPPEDPNEEDPFCLACRFIVRLLKTYPEAAQQRESRHGCLPLHLASFASCASKTSDDGDSSSSNSTSQVPLTRPGPLSRRTASDATAATTTTHLSAIHAEETLSGGGMKDGRHVRNTSNGTRTSLPPQQTASIGMRSLNPKISPKREAAAVQVINALLDEYPRAIRMDSEGKRLPLHTACAGRATPRVVSTLVTAYPAAARDRNKDGFLPLHLAAHWGVSHPNVAITLLKAYPDATLGRNRWERTPLEEALCMAGENGRPYQSALVRALRKHPAFWTQPVSDLFVGSDQANLNTAVDVDESLADTTTEGESSRELYSPSEREKAALSEIEFGREVDENGVKRPFAGGNFMSNLLGRKKEDPRVTREKDLATPLHLLIQQRKWEVVPERIRANPLEAENELKIITRGGFPASAGFTALHYACERNPPLFVVEALVAAHPMAPLTRCMPGGCLPLHIACTWHCSTEVVQALLTADHGGSRVRDELGNVPLHAACFSGADADIVACLLEAHPQAVSARNLQLSRPIDVTKRLCHDNRRVVLSMLSRKQESLSHRRSRSSSTCGDLARTAIELNRRHGTPTTGGRTGTPGVTDVGQAVEVAFEGTENSDLQWI